MNKVALAIMCVLVGVILWKFLMGKPSQEELSAMQQAVTDGGLLLDVRTPSEFSAGHLEGAINIPVDQLQSRLQEIGDTDRSIVVYCASGMRSRSALNVLRDNGFSNVHDLGSMGNWK